MDTKKGRQRIYSIGPLEGFSNREVAYAAAYMDELRERAYDQIVDLPQGALDFVSGETRLSIGRLGLHLGWAEAAWIARLSKDQLPADLETALAAGALSLFADNAPKTGNAAEIAALCHRVRDEVTLPYLQGVGDFDESRLADGSTVRGVVTHLQWHWVFHSGHIGLLRFEWGSDYEWTAARPFVPRT